MKILEGKQWKNDFLDYYRSKKEYRIQVLAWKNLEKIEDAYYIRPKSLKMALRYLPVVGFYGLFTKAWSRWREQKRNNKYISCGIGKIIETEDNSEFKINDTVAFIAPFHPPLVERLTLPQDFIFNIDKDILPQLPLKEILFYPLKQKNISNQWWGEIISWSIYSGRDVSEELRKKLPIKANGYIINKNEKIAKLDKVFFKRQLIEGEEEHIWGMIWAGEFFRTKVHDINQYNLSLRDGTLNRNCLNQTETLILKDENGNEIKANNIYFKQEVLKDGNMIMYKIEFEADVVN